MGIQVNKNICNVVASGSTGNCEIYHNTIAIDMGIPFSKIEPYINDLQLICLTHRHLDHLNISTLKRIQFDRPSIRFACAGFMVPLMDGLRNIDVIDTGKWYSYGEFQIAAFTLYHDCENIGYRIKKDGYKIIRATDTFTLEGITAKNYDLFCLESNYDETTIDEIIARKEAAGEFAYQKSSANTHLSEQQTNDFFFKNKGEHSQLIRLHESETGY